MGNGIGIQPDHALMDNDGDGCADGEELGPGETLGGQRDPLNPNDFFDTGGDKFADLSDILAVIGGFGGTDPSLDRALSAPPKGPDGIVDLIAIGQLGHSCLAPP
jgi:hypothetical protein